MTTLADSISQMAGLRKLSITCEGLEVHPGSIGHLARLRLLDLNGCEGLEELPSSGGQCTALSQLKLDGCIGLASLPDSISQLRALQQLS